MQNPGEAAPPRAALRTGVWVCSWASGTEGDKHILITSQLYVSTQQLHFFLFLFFSSFFIFYFFDSLEDKVSNSSQMLSLQFTIWREIGPKMSLKSKSLGRSSLAQLKSGVYPRTTGHCYPENVREGDRVGVFLGAQFPRSKID